MEIGSNAPLFKGKDQDGNVIALSDLKGKKVILYFYPEDDTPTCTQEACNLRDNYHVLKERGFEILGVSPDDIKNHQKFRHKFKLPFSLISDPEKKIIEAYGVWGPKNMFGHKYMGVLRHTFVIDEKGRIEKIFKKVRSNIHTDQILKSYAQ
ncbi:MAG: thioredoxin-dependent thiol peroxidase [Chitinophagales bacterium]|nr:thioredoxin-dependent thiol peroxidase [Chitinophagales bacterium]